MTHKIGQILRILAKIHNFHNFYKMLLKKGVKYFLMLLLAWMNENMYNSAIFYKKVHKGKKGWGFFLTPPPQKKKKKIVALTGMETFFTVSLRIFIHFWRLYPTFFRNFFNFLKMKKFSNVNGLECKFQQHFLKEKSKINQNRISSFLVGKRQSFTFFCTFSKSVKQS